MLKLIFYVHIFHYLDSYSWVPYTLWLWLAALLRLFCDYYGKDECLIPLVIPICSLKDYMYNKVLIYINIVKTTK